MQVMHLGNIAGRTTVSVVTPEGLPATAWMSDMFKKHFESIVAEGKDWPPTAEFRVEKRYHTWPMGWDKDVCVSFYESREELEQMLADARDWSLSEDNEIKIKIWEWDLGPNFIEEKHFS